MILKGQLCVWMRCTPLCAPDRDVVVSTPFSAACLVHNAEPPLEISCRQNANLQKDRSRFEYRHIASAYACSSLPGALQIVTWPHVTVQDEYQRYMERVRSKAQGAIDTANSQYQHNRTMVTERVDRLVHHLQRQHHLMVGPSLISKAWQHCCKSLSQHCTLALNARS